MKKITLLFSLLLISVMLMGCENKYTQSTQTYETQKNNETEYSNDLNFETQSVKETEAPTKSPIDEEIDFKKSCEEIEYDDLARNPDKVKEKKVLVTGEVIQVLEDEYSDDVNLRVDITKTSYGYKDTIFVVGELDDSGDRILEDDIISIWGYCAGTYTYETVLGSSLTIPRINMMYYSIGSADTQDDEKPTERANKKAPKKSPEKTPEKPTEKKQGIENDTSSDGFYAYGDGDYVASGLKVTRYAVLHIDYTGDGYFSVTSYEGDEYDSLLVNAIDNYSGDVLVDHSGDFQLQIKSSRGNWNITSSGLTIDDTTSFSGHGDSVTGLTSSSGGTWEITNANTDSYFSVTQYGYNSGYMRLLANEIGSYSGTVKVEGGDNIFFKVKSDGDWTIKKKS